MEGGWTKGDDRIKCGPILSMCLSCCCSTDEKELLQVMCVDKNLNKVAGRGGGDGEVGGGGRRGRGVGRIGGTHVSKQKIV